MYIVHRTSAASTMDIILVHMYLVPCTVYLVPRTMYIVHTRMYIVHMNSTLYIVVYVCQQRCVVGTERVESAIHDYRYTLRKLELLPLCTLIL